MKALDVLEELARYSGYILSVIALIVLIVKPIRNWVVKKIIAITKKEEVEELTKGFKEFKERIESDVAEIKEMLFVNERDRLKGELFNYGNRCRRGNPLTLEEFRYVQEVYQKYNGTLHCNHNGTEEYNFIRDYFNSQYNQDLIKK